MRITFKQDTRNSPVHDMTATVDNIHEALDAAVFVCRHLGGGPLRVYGDGEPLAVVAVALVETEDDMDRLTGQRVGA